MPSAAPLALAGFAAVLAVPATAQVGERQQPVPSWDPPPHWSPYFHDEKGQRYPLLEPVERNSDKDWLFLRFTSYSGPKMRIAVMPIQNENPTSVAYSTVEGEVVTQVTTAQVPVAAIEELLTTALFNTNRFDLVERTALEAVLAEQNLGLSGDVNAQTAAGVGSLLGAQYLVFGSVNDYTPEKSRAGGAGGGSGGGPARRVLGAVGLSRSKAEVGMSFRIADATTGQILFATTEKATAESWGIALGGATGSRGGIGGFERNAPISYAVMSCLNKGVHKLAAWLQDKPWRGAVVKLEEGRVYINAGSNQGLTPGLRLVAMSKGEELTDPETGLSLGRVTTEVGYLELAEVTERFSVASIVEGCETLARGDYVRLAAQ